MTDKQKNILKYSLVGTVALNFLMCLNLYRQIGQIEYKVYSMDSNIMSAIQSLGSDVWGIKDYLTKTNNFNNHFE